jgi:hypothetical protein
MDIFVVLLMLLVVLTYHAEQRKYFKEVYAKLENLDSLIKKQEAPEYKNLRLVSQSKVQSR